MAEEKRLFDCLLTENDKVFDEKMLPLIEKEVKANFQSAKTAGEKMLVTLEKQTWDELLNDVENIDVDAMADRRLKIKNINNKINVIEEMYEELFKEKM
jgi:hypothetical protein